MNMNTSMKLDAFMPKFASAPKKPAQQQRPEEEKSEIRRDSFVPSEKTKQAMGGDPAEEMARLEEMLKNSKAQSEAEAKGFEVLAKCMKIAARIMNGDIVPLKDHKFLSENYPDIYEKAILMRRINPEPKEYKSLVEDEEDETSEAPGEADTSGQPPEIAAMGEGGGEAEIDIE